LIIYKSKKSNVLLPENLALQGMKTKEALDGHARANSAGSKGIRARGH
jgi:hypothetical protein